jgi:hypothetical protein
MWNAAQQIMKSQGIQGFYKGLGTYVVTDGIAGSIKFGSYEVLKGMIARRSARYQARVSTYKAQVQMLQQQQQQQQGTSSSSSSAAASSPRLIALSPPRAPLLSDSTLTFLSAGLAFIASSIVLVPGELLKQRLQMGQIPSLSAGVSQILKDEGVGGFFTGYSAVCYRDVPYTMLELGMYDTFKGAYLSVKNKRLAARTAAANRRTRGGSGELKEHKDVGITQFDEIMTAALTGGLVGYLTNPLDCVKTKLMTSPHLYPLGFPQALTDQITSSGLASLFDGGGARVLWLMPFTAIYLPCYDMIKRKMSNRRAVEEWVDEE